MAKTETIYATAPLIGENRATALASFEVALDALEKLGTLRGREVLYDTLEVSVERDIADDRSLSGTGGMVTTYTTIQVSASGVKH